MCGVGSYTFSASSKAQAMKQCAYCVLVACMIAAVIKMVEVMNEWPDPTKLAQVLPPQYVPPPNLSPGWLPKGRSSYFEPGATATWLPKGREP